MSIVSLVKNINGENGYPQSIIKSLDLLGYSFNKEIKTVAIKPNLCYYWDKTTGQTTDPAFISALIDILRSKISNDITISVIESDASAMKCKHSFLMLGYEKMAKQKKVQLVNLSEEKITPSNITVGNQTIDISVPEIIQKSDLTINVPKIKYTMDPIKVTCVLKNVFGCIPHPKKFEYHPRLGEYIVAANKAMKFDLNIIEGNIVSGVKPRKLGLVMSGVDPVAMDVVASKIMGINPETVEYLKLSKTEGIGKFSYSIHGDSLNYFIEKYPKKTFENKIMNLGVKTVIKIGLGPRLGLS